MLYLIASRKDVIKMKLYFEIYQNENNLLYYWRLRKIGFPSIYFSDSNNDVIDEIIATGHQGYRDIESAKNDIRKVISTIPTTEVKII